MRELPVAPICSKPTLLFLAPNQWHVGTVSRFSGGRFAIVTDVERGMRWTCWPRQTSDIDADGEVVWYQCRRFEVPAGFAASPQQELQIESGTGILILLVPFAFRSS